MSVFFYTRGASPLHRLDPRAKITLLATVFAALSIAGHPVVMTAALIVLIALFALARSMASLRRMGPLFALIGAVTFGLWMLFYDGPLPPAHYAGAMSLRFMALLLAGLLFLSVTSLEEFTAGLIMMGLPYPVAFTVSLSFRLVIVFVATGHTIVEAQKVRGNDVTRGSVPARIRGYVPLLIPLILNGIKKADTLTLALESKGFSPGNRIRISDRYRLRGADVIAIGAGVLVLAAVLLVRFGVIALPV
ncbi:MAG TPA: energy-coupling factor transporter transmembrane component T [Spirochaetota bacterium]|nr:energy-coupling factor transporter transmembrane component T [Spirochaetota bacterium]HNT12824.1 energy-coupling factor transporter transmembrane component T [Spirochaetota bacterium]